jgi:hypothetical protein
MKSSEEFVTQLTLNYLISKSQLAKLNQKNNKQKPNSLKNEYKDDIKSLFSNLLNDELPEDILSDVVNSFEYFIEKSITYISIRNNQNMDNLAYLKKKDDEGEVEVEEEDDEGEEGEEEEEGEEGEEGEEEEDDEGEEEEDEGEEGKEDYNIHISKFKQPTILPSSQQLPLEWFQKVQNDYKKSQIVYPKQKKRSNYKK